MVQLKLTAEEQRMLDGKEGLLVQKAMEFIVRYASLLGAEELCKVTKAHLFSGAHKYMKAVKSGDADEAISRMHFCSEEKVIMDRVACFAQTDAYPMDPDRYKEIGISEAEGKYNQAFLDRYQSAGVHLVGSCVPYLLGFIPTMGEHYVSTESHAVIFMNSLWGACANADGIEASFCSAVCGRTPYWGNHIMSNRKGTHVFEIECELEGVKDWDLLGYFVGFHTPSFSTPILNGKVGRPDVDQLRQSFAAMATSGGIELCHIVGVTPEAMTLEMALGGKEPVDVIKVGRKELDWALGRLHAGGNHDVEFVSLGCPHYSIAEIKACADFLADKKVSSNTELQIWTAQPIKSVADRCGYTEIIERAGAKLLTCSCPTLTRQLPENATALAFDSAKQANYMRPLFEAKVLYGSMQECLKAAVEGKWTE